MNLSDGTADVSPMVSVVTPFFNSAQFLEECIHSVLSQTYENFEFLLVDNMSTDGSGEIARRFAAVDTRIRVIRNSEFVPQVENYNGALTHVSPLASWVKIVQADDKLLPDCLRRMVDVGTSGDRVAIVSSFYMKGDRLAGEGIPFGRQCVEGHEAIRSMLLTGCHPLGSPSSVLYRADAVRALPVLRPRPAPRGHRGGL